MTIEYKKMKDLERGDKLLGSNNNITTVTDVYEEHIPERMYQLEFDNGEIIEASGNHLWYSESQTDLDEKDEYFTIAKEFFEKNVIPNHDETNPYYPIEIILDKFPDSAKSFIYRVCLSLGHSGTTPEVFFDGYLDITGEREIILYSFNDLVDFMHSMKEAVNKTGNKYFYFGKVRTTDEIFSIINMNEKINIPTKGDLMNG